MTDVNEVIKWLAGAGSVAVVSWFASWFLEGFVWWDNLQSKVKSLLILVVSLLLGLLATWVLLLPSEVVAPYLPYLAGVVLVVTAWLGTQVAHRADSRAK